MNGGDGGGGGSPCLFSLAACWPLNTPRGFLLLFFRSRRPELRLLLYRRLIDNIVTLLWYKITKLCYAIVMNIDYLIMSVTLSIF